MTASAALRAVVLENPHARLVQIVPALQDMVVELIEIGLFEGTPQRPEFTVAGRIANVLAREINWRRRFMRTTDRLIKYVKWNHRHDHFQGTVEQEIEAALEKLRVAGIAEIDHSRGKGQAWRLIVE